jgi:hypothetical protein
MSSPAGRFPAFLGRPDRIRPAFVRARPTFGEIVERLCPLPSFEPSSNEPMPGPGLPADTAIGWPQAGP